jgi:DNA replication and repair protein RecF
MICNQIGLIHYKNHKKLQLNLASPVVCISGNNGCGKTNILDALYYSAFTKSSFTRSDGLIPHFGLQGFSINAAWKMGNGNLLEIKTILRETQKKEIYNNEVLYKTLSKHIGLLSAVLVAPEDIALINEDSQARRKYLDAILCQTNTTYLQAFLQYQKILQQRNAWLKQLQQMPNADMALLHTLSRQLITYGQVIADTRSEFLKHFLPSILLQYKNIALQTEAQEEIQLTYQTALLSTPLEVIINNNINVDIAAGRTTQGPHKDDILIEMRQQLFKNMASQGQKKSMLFAFKMAEFYYIAGIKKDYPILLLDDVFEKLDEHRLLNLIDALPKENNFQLIVTDTSKERLVHLFTKANRPFINITLPQ